MTTLNGGFATKGAMFLGRFSDRVIAFACRLGLFDACLAHRL
jgi:hypothetical protein